MDAGRELDREVAVKVMGWTKTGRGTEYRTPDGQIAYPAPYSTDIAAAWQVIEILKARFGSHDEPVMVIADTEGYSCLIACGWDDHQPYHRYEGSGATAPLAICRAALRAVGAF